MANLVARICTRLIVVYIVAYIGRGFLPRVFAAGCGYLPACLIGCMLGCLQLRVVCMLVARVYHRLYDRLYDSLVCLHDRVCLLACMLGELRLYDMMYDRVYDIAGRQSGKYAWRGCDDVSMIERDTVFYSREVCMARVYG